MKKGELYWDSLFDRVVQIISPKCDQCSKGCDLVVVEDCLDYSEGYCDPTNLEPLVTR